MRTIRPMTEWGAEDALLFNTEVNILIRAEERTHIWDAEADVLVGIADPECQLSVKSKGEIALVHNSSARVWYLTAAQMTPTERTSDEKFTSYDKPPPMSPEMRMIQEIARKNELQRARDLREMESRYEQRLAQVQRSAEGRGGEGLAPPPTDETKPGPAENASAGADAAEGQDKSGGDGKAPTDEADEKKAK